MDNTIKIQESMKVSSLPQQQDDQLSTVKKTKNDKVINQVENDIHITQTNGNDVTNSFISERQTIKGLTGKASDLNTFYPAQDNQ